MPFLSLLLPAGHFLEHPKIIPPDLNREPKRLAHSQQALHLSAESLVLCFSDIIAQDCLISVLVKHQVKDEEGHKLNYHS